MNKEQLRNYLEQVRLLELDIYTMDRLVDKLNYQRKTAPHARHIEPPVKKVITPPREEDYKSGGTGKAGAIGAGLGLIGGPIGAAMGFAIGNAVGKRQQNKEYEKAFEEYKRRRIEADREYQQELSRHNQLVAEAEREAKTEAELTYLFNTSIDRQIACIEDQKLATKAVLQRIYDMDIVYIKYRSLIPITRFCEYLDSGLRTELGGANGMYDFYERELMSNQIVGGLHMINEALDHIDSTLGTVSGQLGAVSGQLSDVQKNQMMLYQEISTCNERAGQISREMQKLNETAVRNEQRLASIEDSAKMAELNTKMAARRTDALTSMVEYDRAERDGMLTI